MYTAEGNEIFYLHPDEATSELFITVHPTKDCTLTPAEQATMLCDVLNGLIDKALERAVVRIGGQVVR